jgi:hypothetical protein
MRVRIVKHLPRILDGVNLERFERDGVYEVTGAALDLLMVSGYAVEEAEPAATNRKEAIKVFADAWIAPEYLPPQALQITPPRLEVEDKPRPPNGTHPTSPARRERPSKKGRSAASRLNAKRSPS